MRKDVPRRLYELLTHSIKMRFQNISCIILLFLVKIENNEALLLQGNSKNSNETIHGHLGENVDIAEIMEMLSNLTTDLKQQTAEIEHLTQQTAEIKHLKQKAENDRSTIQVLQNRVFILEAELSTLPSTQEFSTYLSGMNQITHSLVENEASDRNLTQQFNKALHDIKQNNISATQELRNKSMELEMLRQQTDQDRSIMQQLNGSLTREMHGIKEQIASMYGIRLFTFVKITSGQICFYFILATEL